MYFRIFSKAILFVLATSLFVSLAGCKKYDNGPYFSFRTKKARLVNKWKLATYYVDGQEKTDVSSDTYEFKEDGGFTNVFASIGANVTIQGKWEFLEKKGGIKITYDNGDVKYFEILRLKKEELWLESSVMMKKHEHHFVPAE